jgi:hypothetical protein
MAATPFMAALAVNTTGRLLSLGQRSGCVDGPSLGSFSGIETVAVLLSASAVATLLGLAAVVAVVGSRSALRARKAARLALAVTGLLALLALATPALGELSQTDGAASGCLPGTGLG